MQVHDASLITKVARYMIEKHGGDAVRYAEMRAMDLREREPGASAGWHLVANTIGILRDDTAKPPELK